MNKEEFWEHLRKPITTCSTCDHRIIVFGGEYQCWHGLQDECISSHGTIEDYWQADTNVWQVARR